MGGETMFELKTELEKWRTQLSSNEACQESDLNELESHLKDNIEELNKKGLSEEESYWIAKHRLGDTEALNIEFSKVNQAFIWRKRMLLLLLGYFVFTLIPKLVSLVTLSLYFLDLKWMFFRTPSLSPDYRVPIPLFLLILFIIGGIFCIITSQKTIFKKNKIDQPNYLPKLKMGYKFVIAFLGIYLITAFGNLYLPIIISQKFNRTTFGFISASGSIFSMLWNIFLFISLVIITLVLLKDEKKTQSA
jgi:hypothetical protein